MTLTAKSLPTADIIDWFLDHGLSEGHLRELPEKGDRNGRLSRKMKRGLDFKPGNPNGSRSAAEPSMEGPLQSRGHEAMPRRRYRQVAGLPPVFSAPRRGASSECARTARITIPPAGG